MLKKGDRLYSVATGSVDLRNKNSRKAMSYIKNLEGFVAVHPAYPNGMLSFFDSLNNAKRARNNMIMQGIKTGNNICEF